MIWIRRLFTVPLVMLFVAFFALLLLVTQVNHTVGEPDFYNKHMEKADVYNFIYDGLLPAAMEEIEPDDPVDNPINVDHIEADLIAAARKVLPPEWLQQSFESATTETIPYLLGSDDEFTYTLDLKDRIYAAAEVIKYDILEGETLDYIYDDLMAYSAQKIVERLDNLPYTIPLTAQEIEDALRTVLTKEVIVTNMRTAIDNVLPYFTVEADHYTIRIPVEEEQVDAIAKAFISLCGRQETYDFLVEEVVDPIIREDLEPEVELPFEVVIYDYEVVAGVSEVLPPEWLQSRLEELVEGVVAYVKGESETIEMTVDLADRKPIILEKLIEIGDQKLEAKFQSISTCNMTEFNTAKNFTSPGNLPSCRPHGVSYERYKTLLGISVSTEVQQRILAIIPDQWVYTYDDLAETIGEGNINFLENAQEYVTEAWTFTDNDLKNEMDDIDDYEALEDVRDWLSNNYTITESDITDEMSDYDRDSFDMVRSAINTGRTWLWTLWIIPILILIDIGFIGGRNWWSRISWSVGSVFIGALIVFVLSSTAYSSFGVDDVIDLDEHKGLDLVMAEKGSEILENVTEDFASGIESGALSMLILSSIILAVIIGWRVKEWYSPSPVSEPESAMVEVPVEEAKRPRRGRRTVSSALLEMMIDLSSPDEGTENKPKKKK